MSKLVQRLILFFIGLPVLVFSIVAADYKNFLLLHLIIIITSAIATLEVYNMIKQRIAVQHRYFVLILALMIPVSAAFAAFFEISQGLIAYIFTLSFMLCAICELFTANKTSEEPFINSIARMSSTVFILFYTGFLITYLSRMTVWEFARHNLGVFILMVYSCDSIAWFFGMTMGKNNRGVLTVSPNKSIAGFIGGFAGSVVIGILAKFLFPQVFSGSWIKIIVLGLAVAFAAIMGDLAESVLKRSGHIKDSGNVIPGRGGMMDSIDSLLLAAPVYYFLAKLLYNFS